MKIKAEVFHLKAFSLNQKDCLMKVGTDSLLLGAWTQAVEPKLILDIGTGTGILALMMAQKFPKAKIQAVEIDAKSALVAEENFRNSPWKDRVELTLMPIQEFVKSSFNNFDLIICNPPYFKTSAFHNQKPNPARQTLTLNHETLSILAAELLNPNGKFACILPAENGKDFIELASLAGLFPEREMIVYSKPERKQERILLEFSNEPTTIKKESLVIRNSDGSYSGSYQILTREFHPHF